MNDLHTQLGAYGGFSGMEHNFFLEFQKIKIHLEFWKKSENNLEATSTYILKDYACYCYIGMLWFWKSILFSGMEHNFFLEFQKIKNHLEFWKKWKQSGSNFNLYTERLCMLLLHRNVMILEINYSYNSNLSEKIKTFEW